MRASRPSLAPSLALAMALGVALPPGVRGGEVARARPGDEHRKLAFLVGDWGASATLGPADLPAGTPWKGTVSIRWDLSGLLLTERWALEQGQERLEARVLWSRNAQGAFHAFRFDTAGAAGEELALSAVSEDRAVLEGTLAGEPARVRRVTYALARPDKPEGVLRLVITTEEGPAPDQLTRTSEAVLSRGPR